jgi:hypothetical protein
MIAVLGCALLLCIGSWLVGRAVLRLLRVAPPAIAPPVGFAALTIVADGTLNVGGNGVAAAVVVAGVIVAALAAELRARESRAWGPPAGAAVAAGLCLAAGSLPFLASGRVGTLGVSLLNDLAIHEYWAWARDLGQVYPGLIFPHYPLGAHSLVGALSELTGTSVERGFSAILIGVPALTALTAYGAFTHLRAGVRILAAALSAFPYLGAAFLGEGSFKEPMVVLLVLGFALALQEVGRTDRVSRRQLVPPALLAAACCLIEGTPGLAWPALTLVLWGTGEIARRRADARQLARQLVAPAGVAILVMLVAVAPSLGDLVNFSPNLQGSNLPGYLPFAESMGIWFETDFRLGESQVFSSAVLAVIGVLLLVYSAWWWQRRRGDALPAAAVSGLIMYLYIRSRSNAYLTAKTEMVWAGLYMVTVVGALSDLAPKLPIRRLATRLMRERTLTPRRGAIRLLQTLALASFAVAAARSSELTLRTAPVDSDARAQELTQMRRIVHGQPTIMLVADDFAPWELRGARQAVLTNYGIADQVPFALSPTRPAPMSGVASDFASVTSASLNRFRYAVTTTSTYAASPPPNWHLVLHNQAYDLWRRSGMTPQMAAPPGSTAPVGRLDCSAPSVRAVVRNSIAIERPAPVLGPSTSWRYTTGERLTVTPSFAVPASGRTITQSIQLPPGSWNVSIEYQSGVPLRVDVGPRESELPADLDVFGPYWSVGVFHSSGEMVAVTVALARRPFPGIQALYPIGPVVATRVETMARPVPALRACGHFVDWLVARAPR